MKAKEEDKKIFAEVKTPSGFFRLIRETYDAIDASKKKDQERKKANDES